MVATLRKVNPNEWATNDRPNTMFCYLCFFNVDCAECMKLKTSNMNLTGMREHIETTHIIIENIRIREEQNNQTMRFLLDEVSIILDKGEEDEKGKKKKVKKCKKTRRTVRKRSKVDKKKVNDPRK